MKKLAIFFNKIEKKHYVLLQSQAKKDNNIYRIKLVDIDRFKKNDYSVFIIISELSRIYICYKNGNCNKNSEFELIRRF